jgi:hypothetical protein
MNPVSKIINIKICYYTVSRADFYRCNLLISLPLQQWLHERALMLRYMYIACLDLCLTVHHQCR